MSNCSTMFLKLFFSISTTLAILTSFDNRLVKLEKSILPLYTSTQILTRRGNSQFSNPCRFILNPYKISDIESALQRIDEVASNQEGIAAEEALILRGCVPTHFEQHRLPSPLTSAPHFPKSSVWSTCRVHRCPGTPKRQHRFRIS